MGCMCYPQLKKESRVKLWKQFIIFAVIVTQSEEEQF